MHRFNHQTTGTETDASRLARAAAGGDVAAFDALYEMHGADLFGAAYCHGFDVAAAANAVAQAYADLIQLVAGDSPCEDVRAELLSNVLEAVAVLSDDPMVDAAPPSVRDEVSAASLRQLSPAQRSALYLVDVLHIDAFAAASIVGVDHTVLRQAIRTARAGFRSSYVSGSYAVDPSNESPECRSARTMLVAYAGRSLNAGHTVAVEQHLGSCTTCRNVVARIDDLEIRIRRALPSAPAWLHQLAADAVPKVPTPGDFLDEEATASSTEPRRRWPIDVKAFAGAAVVTAVVGFAGVNAFQWGNESDLTGRVVEQASATTTTTPPFTTPAPASVSTPEVTTVPTTTTIAPAPDAPASTQRTPAAPSSPQTVVIRRPAPEAAATPPPAPTTTAAPVPSYELRPGPPPTTLAPPAVGVITAPE